MGKITIGMVIIGTIINLVTIKIRWRLIGLFLVGFGCLLMREKIIRKKARFDKMKYG